MASESAPAWRYRSQRKQWRRPMARKRQHLASTWRQPISQQCGVAWQHIGGNINGEKQ